MSNISEMKRSLAKDTDRRRDPAVLADETAQRLAAIIELSEDAILTKDLDGTITSWNDAAERLFGYRASEIVGTSIMRLLPPDRPDDEAPILARLRRGEHVRHYETVRRRKDGSLVDISLSVSPLRDRAGNFKGASTIARDITERKRLEERQRLLFREMDHRLKNLFAISVGLVGMSVPEADTPAQLASIVQNRLGALARAHALTMPADSAGIACQDVKLHDLIRTILSPYDILGENDRLWISGDDLDLTGGSVTALALIFYELATNAAKYGALSSPSGRLTIECAARDDVVALVWIERGAPPTEAPPEEGFGTLLGRIASGQLGGSIDRTWEADGLRITLEVARNRL